MSRDNDYNIEELEQRYDELEESQKSGLRSYWPDIVKYLDRTDRDWVKQSHIQDYHDIDRGFLNGYNGFLKVFKPPLGPNDAFAFYQMNYDDMVEAGEKIGLPEVTIPDEKKNPIDEALEADYEDF